MFWGSTFVSASVRRRIIRAHGAGLLFVLLGTTVLVQAATPNLTGYWKVDRYIEEIKTVDGQTPPLKPEAKKLYEERRGAKKAGKADFDPTMKCVNPGVPRLMFLPYAVEFLQSPHELTMLFAWNRLYRNIDLTGKTREAPYPMFVGVSSAKWEGNTLSIETSSLKDEMLLDASGLPASGELKVTERYALDANGNKLTTVITIDDPLNYTRPWQTQVAYHRLRDSYEFYEDVCLDRIDAGEPAIVK
jgi:hypothetical protein